MNPHVEFFLRQKIGRFENEASGALHRIRLATTMRDVKFASDLHPDALIRRASEVTRGKQRVLRVATDRMSELLEIQLEELRKLGSAQEMKDLRVRLLQQHWPYLRGTFAQVYVRADRTSQGLIYQQEKAEANEVAPDHPPEDPPRP